MSKSEHRKQTRRTLRRILKDTYINFTRRGIHSTNYGDGVRKGQIPVDQEEMRYMLWKAQGKRYVHYCPDWDFMAIHSEMPEMEACLCEL